MTMITNPTQIATFRYCTILRGLGLEIKGLRCSKGMTMYALAKKELGLKGSKTAVYNELALMLGKPTIQESV
jgi:hypothetical protein